MIIDVIIPTLLRPCLMKLLISLGEQTYKDFGIIVSPDLYGGFIQKTRNQGVKRSKADIILFTDDDCIADPLWIENYAKAWAVAPKEVGAIQGWHDMRDKGILWGFGGYNMSFRRDVLVELGGFDEDFPFHGDGQGITGTWREETELAWHLLHNGYHVLYCPEARVAHHPHLHAHTVPNLENEIYLCDKYPEFYEVSDLPGKIEEDKSTTHD